MLMALKGFQILEVAGPDRASFLQGQLTQDVRRAQADGPWLRTAALTPQGRVLATAWLWAESDRLRLLLDSAQAAFLKTHLSTYVLRSKVTLTVLDWNDALVERVQAEAKRHLRVSMDSQTPLAHAMVLAGYAEVREATREHFTAHQLNLDLLDAIGFEKGCYTGQEIVVRTAHRGQAKRRLVTLRGTPCVLAPLTVLTPHPAPVDTPETAIVVDSATIAAHTLVLALTSLTEQETWAWQGSRFQRLPA